MRLTAKFLFSFLALALALTAAETYYRIERDIGSFDDDMRQDALVYGTSLAHAVATLWSKHGSREGAALVAAVNARSRHMHTRWVALDASNGNLPQPKIPASRLGPVRRGEPLWQTTARESGGSATLITYVPLPDAPGIDGTTAIEVTESLAVRDGSVRGTIVRTAAFAGAMLASTALAAALLGLLLIARPLRELEHRMRRIGAGDLAGSPALRQHDEIGDMSRAVDQMRAQLVAGQQRIEGEAAARIAALEQMRHADRLATVGQLAAGVAHEVGTPLAVISGRAQMIALAETTGQEMITSARTVVEQARRIAVIIRQLLDFARKRPAHTGPVDLAELARRSIALLEPMATKQSVVLTDRTPSEPRVEAVADAGQIEQVLMNLIVNAIQATPAKGCVEVGVGCSRNHPDGNRDATPVDSAWITVQDTGSGIDTETLRHVFEPFFTTKDVGEGSGLGLAVAHGIVREHGGWIAVASEPGKGSKFTVHLPAAADRAS